MVNAPDAGNASSPRTIPSSDRPLSFLAFFGFLSFHGFAAAGTAPIPASPAPSAVTPAAWSMPRRFHAAEPFERSLSAR
ncbi:hypothetical protein DN536_33730 [Burkholderia multivorans]|nr:hypothetical protein DN536_33730 [Burkholderia multivorans]